jgi:hypothetical protein
MTAADAASQSSIDRLLANLAEAHDDDVDALVDRYKAGSITLAALVTQAHDILAENADDDLDDIEPGKRGGHHVVLYGLLFASLGGLAMLADKPKVPAEVGETSTMFALQAAAAEYGASVKPSAVAAARVKLDDRLQTVADSLASGDISGPQAAAYVETILYNDAWLTYGTEQRDQAVDAGETHAWWEVDSPKQGCSDCQDREDNSPYEIDDLPGVPGDGSTDCGPGCLCSVRYGKDDEEKAVKRDNHCPKCKRWIGRGIPDGAEAYCPAHKGVTVGR